MVAAPKPNIGMDKDRIGIYLNFLGRIFMNSAYIYLQLYRFFDGCTPLKADCGNLCRGACCQGGTDDGMYLFPGESAVFKLLKPDWAKIEKSDFSYSFDGRQIAVPFLSCRGECDRYERPLACRIFPLTPYITHEGELRIITDPRAKGICPLAKLDDWSYLDSGFISNVEKTFKLLSCNRQVKAFLSSYSRMLDDYLRFF